MSEASGFLSHLNEKYTFTLDEMRIIIESIPANVFFKDTCARYAMTSRLCSMLAGGDHSAIIGKTDLEIQPDPALGRKFYDEDMEILRTKQGMRYLQEMQLDGSVYYYQISKEPVFAPDGESLMGIIGIVEDVTEIVSLQKELETYSIMDMMTGVYNRTYYEKLLESADLYQYPMAVVMADCNGLKSINDTFGHRSGDYLIQETVNNIRHCLDDKSAIIRMGGDEFLILIPSCDEASCQKFLARVEENEAAIHVDKVPLSTAYGFVIVENGSVPLADAIHEADRRMYEAKRRHKASLTHSSNEQTSIGFAK